MTRAKAELEQLVAMPRPHPLIGAFRAYIAQADKDASAGALAEAGAPADDAATLQSAIEAMTSGEIEKAAEILKDLEARLPNDANVLVAAGKLALKKEDRRTAVKYFEKAIAADKNQFDALAGLANIKWDSGEKQGAIILYRQLIERAAPDNPNIALAKQRFTSYLDGTSEESSN
jgi:tetratricopeptide (TPR) repeat protein